MDSGAKHAAARFSKPVQRPSYYKHTLMAVSYAVGSAIVALCIWPVSAGDILANVHVPSFLTSASDVSNLIHKADQLSRVSFEERWSAVPAPTAEPAEKKNRPEPPRAESRIEKIPFSCELAFSRIVTKGNFSTRCIAGLETSKTDA